MKAAPSFSIRLTLVIFSFQLAGQSTFSKVYQDSNLNNHVYSGTMASSLNNGFLIAGGSNLMRFDSSGNVIWGKVLGSSGFVVSIIPNKDSTYYFLTNEPYSGSSIPVLAKVNDQGGLVWSRSIQFASYQNCISLSACATIDSGVVICGYGYPTSQTINTFVSRFDKLGNLIWSKTIGVGDTSTIYRSIQQTPDSGFVMIGTLNKSTASLIKLSRNGTIAWCKRYSSLDTTNTLGVDVVVKNNKIYSYFIVGTPVFVVCDLTGSFIRAKAFNTPSYHDPLSLYKGFALSSASNKGFLMTAEGYANELVLKIDSASNLEWSASNYLYGSLCATQLSDKSYIISGGGPFLAVKTSFETYQIGVIKLDSLGVGGSCAHGVNVSTSTVSLYVTPSNYTLTQLGSIQSTSLSVASISITQRNGCINSINPGIGEFDNLNSISIYPNPSSGVFSIRLRENNSSSLRYNILNLNGETLREEVGEKSESEHRMDCTSLSPAIYILQVSDNNGPIAIKRLVRIP